MALSQSRGSHGDQVPQRPQAQQSNVHPSKSAVAPACSGSRPLLRAPGSRLQFRRHGLQLVNLTDHCQAAPLPLLLISVDRARSPGTDFQPQRNVIDRHFQLILIFDHHLLLATSLDGASCSLGRRMLWNLVRYLYPTEGCIPGFSPRI